MPQRVRSSQFEARSARLRLAVARKPQFVKIGPGISLGYRRNRTAGTWVLRVADGEGGNRTKAIGAADDFDEADNDSVLDYWQAQDKARAEARVASGKSGPTKPATLREALDAYEADLKTRGGDVGNVGRVRAHLPAGSAGKPVAKLNEADLRRWRDGLTKTLTPATINRTTTALKAALNLAADLDPHIINRRSWEIGLATLPGAEEARNVILTDDVIRALIDAAYDDSPEFGLLVELSAITGARYSQLAKVECRDLQADIVDHAGTPAPRLMIPSGHKGKKGSRPKIARRPVPITVDIGHKLAEVARGRPPNTPLLLKPSGEPWQKSDHSRPFDRAVDRCGLADWEGKGCPAKITIYALRHSSIVRQIRANTPIRIIAVGHDTSVAMIERHYSSEIAHFADDIARAGLLDTGTRQLRKSSGDPVVPIRAA